MWKSLSGGRQWQVLGATLSQALGVTYSVFNQFDATENSSVSAQEDIEWESEITPNSIHVRDCVPPSIDEFPRDLFTEEQRQHGALVLHAIVVAYVCCMLAIVCDRYFVPSLKVITDYLNVPPDIAGATFMAIGTSSPELFSSVIGAFIAKGDIGVGTVVGSAVFNLLAVTGASGIVIKAAAHLEWYPITRDCIVYIFTVASLVVVIHDNVITWLEAACLLFMFCCYLLILYFNQSVRRASSKTVKSVKTWWNPKEEVFDGSIGSLDDERSPLMFNQKFTTRYYSYDDSACPSSESPSPSAITDSQGSSSASETLGNEDRDLELNDQGDAAVVLSSEFNTLKAKESAQYETVVAVIVEHGTEKRLSSTDSGTNKHDDFEQSEEFSLLHPPSSFKLFWFVMWPANLLFRLTIPTCRADDDILWFPVTFLSSIIWLGALSYISFWMVTIIGYTLGIPDTVSGITILAAATSVPELVASVIVVRKGLPNMAISNLVSSNVFDILFCLGLPWLIKALLNLDTRTVVINSTALTYTTMILLSTVVLFYLSLLCFKWRFDWKFGIVALTLYVMFLVLASLYESNVFGDFNPPTCASAVS